MTKFLGIDRFAFGELADYEQRPSQKGMIVQFVAVPGCDEAYFRSRVIPFVVNLARYLNLNYLNVEANIKGGEMSDVFIAQDYEDLRGPGEPRPVLRVLDRYWAPEWIEAFRSTLLIYAKLHDWQQYTIKEET